MSAAHINTAIEGAALAPIGSSEKRELAILCRKAWDKLGRPGLVAGGKVGEAFDRWRHQQVTQCVERGGLRECRHEDYNYIRAQMLRILGAARQADQADLRAATEPRRQALAKLQAECRDALHVARPMAYVQAIAKSKFKTVLLSELAPNQIWQLIFSLRNANTRNKAKTRTATMPGGTGSTPSAQPTGGTGSTPSAQPTGGTGSTPSAQPTGGTGSTPSAQPTPSAQQKEARQ
jgi:hypothetical protein